MTDLNILLVAEEAAGVHALSLLLEGKHHIVGVLTGRDHGAPRTAVAAAAARAGCPVWPATLVRDPEFARTVREHGIDLLLNVHSLFVVHRDVVAAPRIGSFNVHPGPLPGYAGLNAPSWAIYNGEQTHAVTVHWMDPGIDTGLIAYEAAVDITENDTGYTLSAKCTQSATTLLDQLISAAAAGADRIPRVPQGDGPRRYFGRGAPQDGWLDWNAPAKRVLDYVRAADYSPYHSPWGHPRTRCNGSELHLVKAVRTGLAAEAPPGTVGRPCGRAVLVATADDWVALERVVVNEKRLDGRAALEPGMVLGRP